MAHTIPSPNAWTAHGHEGDELVSLDVAHYARIPPSLARPIESLLLRMTGLDAINGIYRHTKSIVGAAAFLKAVLDDLRVAVHIRANDLDRIPQKGPVVLVVNHPFGGIEGIILGAILLRVRTDVKIMANYLLQRIEPVRDLFIFVNPFGTPGAVQQNVSAIRQSARWLRDGGLLVVFPAGEVAHCRLGAARIQEPPWNDTVARIIRKTGASVVPVYFPGTNSWLFHALGLLHPQLRTAMLPRELLNKHGRRIAVYVGERIAPNKMQSYTQDPELTAYLCWRTEALSHRCGPPGESGRLRKPRIGAPISPPMLVDEIERELHDLPDEQWLLTSGEHVVIEAGADQIPVTLQEIGRLREITFRSVGEGTGQAVDLDAFDQTYRHLFLWNRQTRAIAGAYRFAFVDPLRQSGDEGLYSSTLFAFAPDFFDRLGAAIELGRSFVRIENQKGYACLLLLWRGIGVVVGRHPRHQALIGAVSISRNYSDASRRLIVDYFSLRQANSGLAGLVRSRAPLPEHLSPCRRQAIRTLAKATRSVEELSSLVMDLEVDRKGLPILMRHYLKVGAQVLAFTADPEFNDTIDAFSVFDLSKASDRVIDRCRRPVPAAATL